MLSQATIQASNIDGYISGNVITGAESLDPIVIRGLSLANVAELPVGAGNGGTLSCVAGTIRIGSCPIVSGACNLDSGDASTCSYSGSSCPALSMLCG
jgi:hypothetical protein